MTELPSNVKVAFDNLNLALSGLGTAVGASINTLQRELADLNAAVTEALTPPDPTVIIKVDATGSVDVTDAIQVFLNKATATTATASNPMKFKLPAGRYLVDAVKGLNVRPNSHIEIDPLAVIVVKPNGEFGYRVWNVFMIKNVRITGGQYVGDRDSHTYTKYPDIVKPDGTRVPNPRNTHEWGHCFVVQGSSGVYLSATSIRDFTGDAFSVGANKDVYPWVRSVDVTVDGAVMNDCRRQGISATNTDGIKIINNKITNIGRTNGTSPKCGIDLEPDNDEILNKDGSVDRPGSIVGTCTNVTIDNNEIRGCAVYGINVFLRVSNIEITRNIIQDNLSCGIVSVQGSNIHIAHNAISNNGATGVAIKKGTRDYFIDGNTFTLNYAKQSPTPRAAMLVASGVPSGVARDLLIADGATGSVGTNSYR